MIKLVCTGTVIVMAILALIDGYLHTASINACTVGEPINLLAIYASGIPLIQGWVSPGTPEWLAMLCANVMMLSVCLPFVIIVAACASLIMKNEQA